MKIRPLFKWFGTKWSASKHYPAPIHNSIVEPYAGSAGYSLNHCDKQVSLYDVNSQIRDLWRYLIEDATSQSILDIPLDVPVGTDIRSLGLTAGQALLLKHWQRTNNVGDCWTISKWGHKPGQWTANTRSRVAEEIHAIKHWQWLPNPWLWYEHRVATWFIDPPYQYNYQYRTAPIDYASLGMTAKQLGRNGSQVIVCEALGKQGEKPDWLPFETSHSQVNMRRKHSNELLWTS